LEVAGARARLAVLEAWIMECIMRKLVAVVSVLCAASPSAAPAAAQGDPAALVIRVQGEVDVTHGGSAPAPAFVGERLFTGDAVLPGPGSRAVLVTRAGARQVVTERTAIEEPRDRGNPDIFERAVATLARAAAADATTGGRQGMIRPLPGQTSLIAPRNALTVATRRPTFRWTATPGGSYDLMLRKVDGGRPMIYEVGADTVWTLPHDVPDLELGSTYQWTVFVGGRQGGRALPPQDFRVIGLEESVELEDYLSEIEVFGLDPQGDGLFLTVVAYRDMGLFYEARRALDRVEAETGLGWELHNLKGAILTELGHESEARAAFDQADALR
jgi:hypothetical protein